VTAAAGALPIAIDDVHAAAARLGGVAHRTPILRSRTLDALAGAPVALKAENLQRAGAFKFRGAFNAVAALRPDGVCTVSSGNHAQALALAAREHGAKAAILMPKDAPASKRAATEGYGAEVIEFDRYADDRDALAHALAAERGLTLVHPYDEPLVMAGQGTVGVELAADVGDLDTVVVPVGGGGLIAGVATAFRALAPLVRVWGVETAGADAMSRALAAGEPVPTPLSSIVTTLSAPAVSELTLEHARELLAGVLVVSDAAAVAGTVALAEHAKLWAEPAAGCLVPAARRVLEQVGEEAHLGLLVCGGNATVADVARWATG
jgi:threonine dehydratase